MTDPEKTDPGSPVTTSLPADAPWWARWLAAGAKDAWRWASVRYPVAVATAAEIYAQDPVGVQKFVQSIVPVTWWPHLLAIGSLVAVAFRVLNLGKKK